MKAIKIIFCLLLIGFCSSSLFAQSSASFQSILYPRSTRADGLGEQGVASRNAIGAMQYNPAGISFTDSIAFSFSRNPFYIAGFDIPLTSYNFSMRLGKYGNIGIEYTSHDYGELRISTVDNPDGNGESYNYYERSFALGYSYKLTENLSVGAQARYVWSPVYKQDMYDHFLFSAGVVYKPGIFDDRLNLGFSFMNFGSSIEYTSTSVVSTSGIKESYTTSDPTPAQLNIGVEAQAVKNNFFDLNLALGFMKPLAKRENDTVYTAQSSFKSLFNNWGDFPEDITTKLGISFEFIPIYLGAGISFIQEMYLGYFTTGPKDYAKNYFTHGFNVGIEARGIKFTTGYAGRWHNNNNNFSSMFPMRFPWEVFQLSLSSDMSFLKKNETAPVYNQPKNIILSAGYSYGITTGKMKELDYSGVKISYLNNSNWFLEADFYINNNSAIISSFGYSCITENFKRSFSRSDISVDLDVETLSLESGYRYHPLEAFQPLFIQASVGIIRLNPVNISTTPDYYFKAYDRLTVGCVIPLAESSVVIIPKVGMQTIIMEIYPTHNTLHGFNQFEFGFNFGYRF